MNDLAISEAFGVLVEPATIRIERRLPGPVERLWRYLTEEDMRRKWLAAGEMVLEPGAPFEIVWRNDELTDPPGTRPGGFDAEISMDSKIIAVEPMRRLVFAWGEGDVTFDLAPQGDDVLLTVTHRRITDRNDRVMIGAGWHMHLEILKSRLTGQPTEPFWDGWHRLRDEYDKRIPI